MEEIVMPEPVCLLEFQEMSDAEVEGEEPISVDWNEDIKTEIDVEESSILEESSQYISCHKRSGITTAQECVEININTDKPDLTVTELMKSPTGDKHFKCEVCPMSFAERSTLTDHIKTHTGGKRFKYEVCSKCFARRRILFSRIRTQTGEKLFKCEVCSRCFSRLGSVLRHVGLHTIDKPLNMKYVVEV